MAEMSFESLPIIIVSAKTIDAANEFISELIDKDVTEEVRSAAAASCDRVWRLQNKYYTCDVRVRARGSSPAAPALPAPAEAHVSYLTEDEMESDVCRVRVRAGRGAAVRVAACRARRVPDELRALCAAEGVEPVPLGAEGGDEEGEPRGVERVRGALHAHAWRGARGGAGARGEEAVERAERFAAALGALGGGAAHVRSLAGAARRDAAKRLVAAFASALGDHLRLDDADPDPDSDSDRAPDPDR